MVSDNNNNVYIAGVTTSDTGISTASSAQAVYGGGGDAFIAKFDSSGHRIWATYLGGAYDDEAYGIALDNNGNLFVTGITVSYNFPTTPGAYQETKPGGGDAFLAKYDINGNKLWSTYFGDLLEEVGRSVVCDLSGNVFITGVTSSNTFSTPGTHQPNYGGGTADGFLAKFSGSDARLWTSFYGGIWEDVGTSLAIDKYGSIFMAGYTSSPGMIATPIASQNYYGGSMDAFLVKFDSTGTRQWATYYGGTDMEYMTTLALDYGGNVFIGGYTGSANNIATPGSHQPVLGGGWMVIS